MKHQHQETENHSKHSFANRYWLYTRYKHSTYTTKPNSFQWTAISNFVLFNLNNSLKHKYTFYIILAYLNLPRNMKVITFRNNEHTNIIISKPDITPEKCRENHKRIYTTITSQYLSSRKNNKVTNTTPYDIHLLEQILPRHMRAKLAQLRANKSSLSQSYLPTVNPETYKPQCPLCLSHTHDTNRLFNCSQLPTQHNTISL